MKKMLMLGTNTGSEEIVKYAKSIGVYTIVTDFLNPCDSKAKIIADEFWMISTADLNTLKEKCIKENVSAIISGVSDFNVTQAVKLSELLGLPFYCSSNTWSYSRDKTAFKKNCLKYDVPTAKQYFLSKVPTDKEINSIDFPVIIKPIDSSANRGFSYCYTKENFLKGYEKAVNTSPSGNVVVEKLLKGREYTAFYALANGEARLVNFWTMLSQPGMPNNCYSVNISISDCLSQYNKLIDKKVKKMLSALGYRDGIVWIEFMADENGNLNALEIGHRLSGEMLWLPLTKTRKFNSYQWIVDYLINGENNIECLPNNQDKNLLDIACSYILWTKESGNVCEIKGIDEVNNFHNMKVNTIPKVGAHIDAFKYAIIITINAENANDLIEKIMFINKNIKVLNDHKKDILIHFDDYETILNLYNNMN